MRWHIKRTKLLFALIPIISIAFYILTANNNIFADQSFSAFDIYKQISDTAELTPGKDSPTDYTAAENFAIAAGVYLKADAVQSVTNGTVTAMGFYKQTVLNEHIRYNGHIFSESISLSAIASVAEQRYFKDGALLFRKGNASGSSVKSWSDTITELTTAVFRQRYGVVPQEITKYSVTAESILEGSLVAHNADGTHTYELVLDPELAQQYARYEMMTFAGVTAFPNFLSCRLVFTIDDTWHMQTLESYDTYKIDLMGGVKCDSRLTETYTFEGVTMPDRAQPFIDYVPTGNTGGVDSERGPADYLNEGFGDYISGKRALCLTADFALLGETFPLRARIDIAGGDYRFMLGDRIFAAYTGDKVFVALGENKYTLTVSDALALAKACGNGKTPALNLSAADLLGILFENYTLTQTDTHVYIRMPFELFGIGLDVNMGMRILDEDLHVTADTIDAVINVAGVQAAADVRIVDDVTLPALVESEYRSLKPLFTAVQNTVALPAYRLGGTIEVQTNGQKIAVGANVRLVKTENGLQAEGTLSALGQTVNVWYAGETVYVRFGNHGFYANIADLPAVLDELATLVPDSAPALDAAALLPQLLLPLLPENFGIRTALAALENLQYDGATLQLALGDVSLELTHDEILRTLSLDGIAVRQAEANALITLGTADTTAVTVPQDQTFRDVKELLPYIAELREAIAALPFELRDLSQFVAPLKNLLASDTVLLNMSGNVTLPARAVEKTDANGNTVTTTEIPAEPFAAGITLRLPKPATATKAATSFALAATVTLSDQTFVAAVKNNAAGKPTLYIRAGFAQNAPAFRLQLDQATDLLGKLSPLLGEKGAVALLQTIQPLLPAKDFTETAQTLTKVSEIFAALGKNGNDIGGILNTLYAYVQMPSISFDMLKTILAGMRVSQGELALSLPVGGANVPVTLTHNGTHFTALTLSAFTVNDITVEADAKITHNAPLDLDTIKDENCYDLQNLTAFVPVLGDLLTANALRVDIAEGELITPFISGRIGGFAEIQLSPDLQAYCDLTFTDKGENNNVRNTHKIQLRYIGDRFYVRVNNIYVSFTISEINELNAQLKTLTGGKTTTDDKKETDKKADEITTLAQVANGAIETVSVLRDVLGGNSLAELLAHIGTFAPSGNGFTLSASIDAFNITASVTADKTENGNALALDIINFQYGSIVSQNSNLKAAVTAANGITAATDFAPADYVTLGELSDYIAATVDLTKRTKIDVSFYGSVKEEDGTTSVIGSAASKGKLQIVRTAHFMNAYAYLPLTVKGATHNIALTLIDGNQTSNDGKPAEQFDLGNITAYLAYDQGDTNKVFRAKIGSGAAIGIIGSLCDVLNITLPEKIEKILQSAGYTHFPTDVFTTMDIKGLDGLRDTINNVLGTGEDAADMAGGGVANMMGAISGDRIGKVLQGVSLGVDNGALSVRIDNSIFGKGNTGEADIRLSRTENGVSLNIADLMARGDTVNFTALLESRDADPAFTVADLTEAEKATYYDFSTADDLLYSVIRTADLREFDIEGTINLKVFTIDVPIQVQALVKILDDGSTVAAITLEVPYAVLGLLQQTKSRIYYANEMLYFIVDNEDKNGKYQNTEYFSATVDEFMANPMEYLFSLIKINGWIKDQIMDAVNKGGNTAPSTHPQDILTAYNYNGNEYALTINLKNLAGNTNLGDLNAKLATQNGYISGLYLKTVMASVATIETKENGNSGYIRLKNIAPAADYAFPHVSFGQNNTFKSLTFSARNKDGVPVPNSGNLSDLESDLQKIFPVEAAETAAGKAAKKIAKVTAQNARVQQAEKNAVAAKKESDAAYTELTDAQTKLNATPEGAFGREYTESQVNYWTKRARQSLENLTDAQAARVAEAQRAAQYANEAYAAAIQAAQAANGVLTRNTALDHNGFTTEAGVTVGAITAERAQAAYTQAYTAANAAANAAREAVGDENAGLRKTAQTIDSDCATLLKNLAPALQELQTDIAALKAEIDALTKELDAATEENEQTALTRKTLAEKQRQLQTLTEKQEIRNAAKNATLATQEKNTALLNTLTAMQQTFAQNPVATAVRNTITNAFPEGNNVKQDAQNQADALQTTVTALKEQTYGETDYEKIQTDAGTLQESVTLLTEYTTMLQVQVSTVKNLPIASFLQFVKEYLTQTELDEMTELYNTLFANYVGTQKAEYEKALSILQTAYSNANVAAAKINTAAQNVKKDGGLGWGLTDGEKSKATKSAASAAVNAVSALQSEINKLQNAINALTA